MRRLTKRCLRIYSVLKSRTTSKLIPTLVKKIRAADISSITADGTRNSKGILKEQIINGFGVILFGKNFEYKNISAGTKSIDSNIFGEDVSIKTTVSSGKYHTSLLPLSYTSNRTKKWPTLESLRDIIFCATTRRIDSKYPYGFFYIPVSVQLDVIDAVGGIKHFFTNNSTQKDYRITASKMQLLLFHPNTFYDPIPFVLPLTIQNDDVKKHAKDFKKVL